MGLDMSPDPITDNQVRAAADVLGFDKPEQFDLVRKALEAARDITNGERPWGCHCDIEAMDEGFAPDECVLDEGLVDNCIYAPPLRAAGKTKAACQYWRQYDPAKFQKTQGG